MSVPSAVSSSLAQSTSSGPHDDPSNVHSSPDLADERDTDQIRAALESTEKSQQKPLDIAALLKSPDKLKKACRAGIPMPQRKEIWNALFELNTKPTGVDYHTLKLEIFNGNPHPHHFPHIPDFGSTMKWNEAYIHLTHKRINYAKTILCVLACSHATLTHCPFLPDLTCVLLIFFDESQTYEMLERMLSRSKMDEFYFTTNGTDFLRWMKTFSILLESKLSDLHTHMHQKLKLDSSKIFQVWLSRFFIQYMPMRTVFRIVDSFLYEGNKILFRVSLAVLKLHQKELLQTKTSHDFLVKLHSCMTKQTPNELLSTGFDIYLSRTSHMGKIKEEMSENPSLLAGPSPGSKYNTHFHLPRFTKEHDHISELINIHELYSLWSWLPPSAMICDPILLYTSSLHGYSYQTLWKKSCEYSVGESNAIFMLIHDSDSDQILGLYLHKPLPDPPELRSSKSSARVSLYTGATGAGSSSATTSPLPLDPQSFLFVLKPFQEVYKHHVVKKDLQSKAQQHKQQQETLQVVDETENNNAAAGTTTPAGGTNNTTATGQNTTATTTATTNHHSSHHNHHHHHHHHNHNHNHNSPEPDQNNIAKARSHTFENSGESQSFKPYGLAKLQEDYELGTGSGKGLQISITGATTTTSNTSIQTSSKDALEGSNGLSLGGSSSTSSSASVAASKSNHNLHGLTLNSQALQEALYTNTIGGGVYTAHTHKAGGHGHHHHHVGGHMMAGGVLMSNDPALSSHSLLVGPSQGINKSQPLKDLFGALEPTTPSKYDVTKVPAGSPMTQHAAMLHAQRLASSPQTEHALPIPTTDALPGALVLPPSAAAAMAMEIAAGTGDKDTTKSPQQQHQSPKRDVLAVAEYAMEIAQRAVAKQQAEAAAAAQSTPGATPGGGGGDPTCSASPCVSSENVQSSPPSISRSGSVKRDGEEATSEAILLMTDEGFGIVETGGVVLFLSGDLKTAVSGPSKVFSSPSFAHYQGRKSITGGFSDKNSTVAGKGSILQRGKFNVSAIEVWSFAMPGSEQIEQLSPRAQIKAQIAMEQKVASLSLLNK